MWSVQAPDRPTFYLDPDIQGILSAAHAQRVGASVTGLPPEMHSVYQDDYKEEAHNEG